MNILIAITPALKTSYYLHSFFNTNGRCTINRNLVISEYGFVYAFISRGDVQSDQLSHAQLFYLH